MSVEISFCVATVVVLLTLAFAYALRPHASRRQESWFVPLLATVAVASVTILWSGELAAYGRLALLLAAAAMEVSGLGLFNKQRMLDLPHDRRTISEAAFVLMGVSVLVQAVFMRVGMALPLAGASLVLAYVSMPSVDMYLDPKTGALKREGMQEVIAWRMRRGKIAILAVAVERYEDLRMLNGEAKMSQALTLVANFLAQLAAGTDVTYLGRGRFLVVGDEKFDVRTACATTERRFQEPWQVSNVPLNMSASLALLPPTDRIPTAFEVLATMDKAMDEAVLNEGSEPVVVDERLEAVFDEHAHVRRVLESAMERDAVEVWFQPLYSTAERRAVGAEALARLRDDDGEFISPEVFIGVAERSGVMRRLGEQIFEKACAFVASANMEALGISFVNVNLSPLQCLSEELPEHLRSIAQRHGVPMDFFHMEITESAMVDVSILREQMSVLVSDGSKFSLDDYGTGYSNLTRMASLPFANVKLDRSIVWDYFSGLNSFLPSLVSTFHNQGLEVTAEGVETEEMVRGLEEMGCDLLQGFYFSCALPPMEFVAYVRGQ